MSLATTSQLAEKVRVAVACFRVAEKATGPVYLLLEAATGFDEPRGDHERVAAKRLLIRRIYAGEHKNVEGKWTVVLGYDLNEPVPTPVCMPAPSSRYEITVRGTPFGAVDAAFEGVFELKSIDIPKSGV